MAVLDVQFMNLPGWSCAASYFFITSEYESLILWNTPCERVMGGLVGLAGQGVTKIAPGQLKLHLA
eukprot:1140170-Pelagomonas_calceolata.AAC.3